MDTIVQVVECVHLVSENHVQYSLRFIYNTP